MNFCSDNTGNLAPEILAALAAANDGSAMPYGNDEMSQRLEGKFGELFETEVAVFPVATGTAANALALSVMVPPFGAIYCHAQAHIHTDECGAPELFSGGAKLVPVAGENGKIDPDALAATLAAAEAGVVHHVQPAAISLTQATEAGTIYQIEKIQQICAIGKDYGLPVHMDGARFANAIATLNCSPADVTWKAGVDVLSFGATKNGAMAAEAVVFFNRELAETFVYRRKRGGHLWSKMRYLSAQLDAYISDDLWLRNARHANQMATRLARGLQALSAGKILYPVQGNEVFVCLAEPLIATLQAQGFQFYRWQNQGDGAVVRLVTGFNTPPEAVRDFLEAVERYQRSLSSLVTS
ncbi:low specificity L-threonine aldolase [Geitlerinema sp. PCC 9228]|jgi:threonine aldolase|uniref:threonine aldolase family protein n=1 Tax=Geitlerinema sp. PCC 9228 TaxID=111611 RepID=UPI0008F9BCEF|nr:low specificity L-threonine aldolase [Geitlerinema sp. PCC 9228]